MKNTMSTANKNNVSQAAKKKIIASIDQDFNDLEYLLKNENAEKLRKIDEDICELTTRRESLIAKKKNSEAIYENIVERLKKYYVRLSALVVENE